MSRTRPYNYGFIGIGNMATAILHGMLQGGMTKPKDVLVADPSAARLKNYSQKI